MKTYQVKIYVDVNGRKFHSRTACFWQLSEALEYAAGREGHGEMWEVCDRITGERWASGE